MNYPEISPSTVLNPLGANLRFVAAVGASCSGDKSDKEESAGGFRGYGD